MNFSYDHDRFANKNRAMAGAYGVEKKDKDLEKKGFDRRNRDEEASCFNCKLKARCVQFRKMRSGGSLGAASFTGNEKFLCDRYIATPVKKKSMSDKEIKSMLKNFKKGRLR